MILFENALSIGVSDLAKSPNPIKPNVLFFIKKLFSLELPIVTLSLLLMPYTSRLLTIIPFSSSFFLVHIHVSWTKNLSFQKISLEL